MRELERTALKVERVDDTRHGFLVEPSLLVCAGSGESADELAHAFLVAVVVDVRRQLGELRLVHAAQSAHVERHIPELCFYVLDVVDRAVRHVLRPEVHIEREVTCEVNKVLERRRQSLHCAALERNSDGIAVEVRIELLRGHWVQFDVVARVNSQVHLAGRLGLQVRGFEYSDGDVV